MILLWGLLEDGTMKSVHDRLVEMNAPVLFVNHAEIDKTELRFNSTPRPQYTLRYKQKSYELDGFTSAYLRPYNFRDYLQFSGEKDSNLLKKKADTFHHLINSWAEHSSAKILNRPSAEATNHSKLFQSIYLLEAGFSVPESLVSNNAGEIFEFHMRHGETIYKSMSSVRSIVKEFIPEHIHGIENMGPVFFQQKITGVNVRVHVIDERVFACKISSKTVDYRYGQSEMVACSIPDEVATKCIQLTKNLGLILSGIDLILAKNGQWYCLEANPSPGFSYFDRFSESSIAGAVAESLMASKIL